MHWQIITLTTDFGSKDPYVAEMKAVILALSSNVTIVDISHQTEKFNIRMGAYALASAAPYFPNGTVHVAVVDPGVGTKRQPIIVQTDNAFFVGPDNGVLSLAAKNAGGPEHIHIIANRRLMLSKVSRTFHGRDIFAPAAAHLANGISPKEFGPEIGEIAVPAFAKITKRQGVLMGEVVHVEDFGNIITSFEAAELKLMKIKHTVNVKLKNVKMRLKFCKAYGDVEENEPLALIGSHNFLEISVNLGNAARFFRIGIGDKVTLCRSCSNPESC